jgi:hypothetical protein
MAEADVEKVGVDNADDGGQQPETQDAQTQDTVEQTEPSNEGAPANDPGNDAETDPAASDGAGGDGASDAAGSGRKKKDNGKVDFPIADAQYRNEAGEVVTAATLAPGEGEGEGEGEDGTLDTATLKLLAVPRPIFDEDGEPDRATGKKPVLYAGWNHRKHNPLKKDDFVDEAEFVNYQAFTFRIKAAVFMEKAKVAEKRAARLKKFGNQTQRKLVDKIAKMREQLAAFEKQAEAEKIDITGLDD